MLLPFQRYRFVSQDSFDEFRRKFQLMMDHRITTPRRFGWMKRGDAPFGKRYTGVIDENSFQIVLHKPNGDEDLVSVRGTAETKGNMVHLTVQTRITGTYLMQTVGSLVVVLVGVFMYAYMGKNVFKASIPEGFSIYLIALLLTTWVNMRRYSQKATTLLEELMEWLELNEEG